MPPSGAQSTQQEDTSGADDSTLAPGAAEHNVPVTQEFVLDELRKLGLA